MASRVTRRSFLKSSAALAGAAAASSILCRGPILLAAGTPPSEKVGVAVIGCGGQGLGTHVPPALDQNCVAFVDADDKQLAKAMDKAKGKNQTPKTYNDYRKMFDECHKDLDVVFIATCNHHHFLPAMLAMELGKGAYVEKPMAHSVEQCRQMAAASKKYKVATQMGNQGHYGEGFARCVDRKSVV
jgi:predicted dehydrogenase